MNLSLLCHALSHPSRVRRSPGSQPSPVPGRRGEGRSVGIPGADLVGPGPGKGDMVVTILNSVLGAWQGLGVML